MKRVWDWFVFCCLIMAVLSLSGCAVLDWLFVPKPGESVNSTPGATMGAIINYFIPGAGALIATAGAVYGKLRGSAAIKEREAHEATLGAIQEAKQNANDGKVDVGTLDSLTANYHKDAGTELLHQAIQGSLEKSV